MKKYPLFNGVSIHGDEFYTIESDVEIIAQHIKKPLVVWCPFNDVDGAFPSVLKKHGHKVIATDTDFFETEPPEGVNAIISNPPFSRKKEVLDRCKDLGIPFAFILPMLFLNSGVPFDYGYQFIFYRKRRRFIHNGELQPCPRDNSFVLSDGLLRNDFNIVM